MRRSTLAIMMVGSLVSPALAQVWPVAVDAGLSWPAGEHTLLVAPHMPARMFGWGGVDESTVFELYVAEALGEGEFHCTIEGPGVPGIDELGIEHVAGGVVFSSATFPCAVATDPNGLGVFDYSVVRGGGRSLSNHYLRLSVPGREYCGYGQILQVTSPDLNGDLAVSLPDLTLFAQAFLGDLLPADLNGDDREDLADLSLFSQAYLAR